MEPPRRTRPFSWFILFAVFVLIVCGLHAPWLALPFFWDELGYYVPAAIDLFREHRVVPRLTLPNMHPPGVPAYLAAVWSAAGYSIPATRAAMLLLAALAALATFLLAIRMCRGLPGTPAFPAAALLILSPLFFAQAMLVHLDMPAMLFTVVALLLFFEERFGWAALASAALVLAKETGLVIPLVLGGWLASERRWRDAAWFLLAPAALGAWLFVLWRTTGSFLGSPGFGEYNVAYPLHPLRLAGAAARRIYYLAIADFHWVGVAAIVYAWRKSGIFRSREWKVAGLACAVQTAVVTALGGATLERYLLPVLPLLYIATASAWSILKPGLRRAGQAVMFVGMAACIRTSGPWPFPFENNLAFAGFVDLHRTAAGYLEREYPGRTVHSAWPFTDAVRRPEFGYVKRPIAARETNDFRKSSLERLQTGSVDVLVMYSRERDIAVRFPAFERFRERLFDYRPQADPAEVAERLRLVRAARWTRGGQWIEVLARPGSGSTGR